MESKTLDQISKLPFTVCRDSLSANLGPTERSLPLWNRGSMDSRGEGWDL
jgi:hypothetical protein